MPFSPPSLVSLQKPAKSSPIAARPFTILPPGKLIWASSGYCASNLLQSHLLSASRCSSRTAWTVGCFFSSGSFISACATKMPPREGRRPKLAELFSSFHSLLLRQLLALYEPNHVFGSQPRWYCKEMVPQARIHCARMDHYWFIMFDLLLRKPERNRCCHLARCESAILFFLLATSEISFVPLHSEPGSLQMVQNSREDRRREDCDLSHGRRKTCRCH